MQIKSYWQYKTGRWDHKEGAFVDKKLSSIKTKTLNISIEKNEDGDNILYFKGGPTGHESYYLETLCSFNFMNYAYFCICAGTINRWAQCWVKSKDLSSIIKKWMGE